MTQLKRCSKCKKFLDESEFHKNKSKKDGLQPECKICRKGNKNRKESNENLHTEKQKILNELKINGCSICGYNKTLGALDFHHVNPKDKKFYINSQCIFRTDFINELQKCILLCKNCHYEIEEKERKIDYIIRTHFKDLKFIEEGFLNT